MHIADLATGSERVVTTNDSGDFTAQNLAPANYSIRVEKTGFKTAAIASIPLDVGKIATEPVVLQVGAATETIQIGSDTPQLQTEDATIGQVISQVQVNDSPLNGRDVLQLATLSAGVSAAQPGNTNSSGQYGQRNLYITVDGGRPSSTNYVMDGVYTRSLRFNNMSLLPSIDAIQEFNVVRSVASTEYGQGTAAVTMVTKSGGNQFHGSAYEFTRSEIFDARNYFSTYKSTPKKPVYHRNQYGATLGGPVTKDKIFFFGGYEAQRSAQGRIGYAIFPTAAQLAPANYLLANVLKPTFAALQPNCDPSACNGNNYVFTSNFVDNYDTWTGRLDQTLSSKQSLFARYIDYNAIQLSPNAQTINQNPLIGRNFALGHTYLLSPTVVNEFRLGYNRTYNYGVTVSQYTNDNYDNMAGLRNLQGGIAPSEFGRPSINIQGFSQLGEGGFIQGDTENVYSIGDTIADTIGHHTIRAGIQFQQRQVRQISELNADGGLTFNQTAATATTPAISPLQNFISGVCSTCSGSAGTSLAHYTDQAYGIFANDIWQLTNRLTLNYGLRWEYLSPFVERSGLEAGFDIKRGQIAFHKIPPPCSATSTAPCIPAVMINLGLVNTTPNFFGPGIIPPDKTDFAPRIGVAFQVKPRLVVRAGFGIYIENTNTNELQFTRNIAPLYITQQLINQPVTGLFPPISEYKPLPGAAFPAPFGVDPNNRTPYNDQWDFSLEQDLGHQTVLEMAYTGSTSHLLWRRYDRNEDTTFAPNSNQDPSKGPVAVRPYPQFSHGMLTSANIGHANFNGGSVKIEQRPIHGLYYLAVYQWSKNLDDESGEADSNDTSYSNNLAFDHSYSNFDVRNRGTISGGYALPFGRGQRFLTAGIGNALAGGWTIQPIISIHSGFPFSLGAGGPDFGQYVPWRVNLAPRRTSGALSNPTPGHWFDGTAYVSPIPGFQGHVTRNTLRGPGTIQNDFSAIKNFHIYDQVTAQFRAEAFNIMNHPIFGNPGADLSRPSTLGVITSTSADSRDLQFALKILW